MKRLFLFLVGVFLSTTVHAESTLTLNVLNYARHGDTGTVLLRVHNEAMYDALTSSTNDTAPRPRLCKNFEQGIVQKNGQKYPTSTMQMLHTHVT